jgi:aldose 1-epimerase
MPGDPARTKILHGDRLTSDAAPSSERLKAIYIMITDNLRKNVLPILLGFLMSLTGIVHAAPATVTQAPFGNAPNGQAVSLYTLTNAHGMRVQITNYGGIITLIDVPDKQGRLGDVILGYDNLKSYIKNSPYFGAIVGRYANRIAKGRFTLDGKTYHLFINNAPNTLHGGKVGFDKLIWTAMPFHKNGAVGLSLRYLSPNGQEGYPGNLRVHVVYTLLANNALRLDYTATTDQDTVINLSNHAYYNLAGQGNGTVLDHVLTINADHYTPVDKTSIPTGKIAPVAGTPFDFRTPHTVGARIHQSNQQLRNVGNGYDHNWVLNQPGHKMIFAARVYCPRSGRVLTVQTTQPGLQVYSGNYLDGTIHGRDGKVYVRHGALVLETQHFPDSPNQPNFPTTELKPGQIFRQSTILTFSVAK